MQKMAKPTKYGTTRTVPHRRKRDGRTNYKKRLTLLRSGQPRLVIRKALGSITAQIVEYNPDGDRVVVSVNSRELEKMGWKAHKANLPSAYLTGLLLGTKSKKKKVKNAVLDLGLQTPIHGGRLFAALKGAVDAGMDINCNKEAFPSDDRISGKHIASYASKLKADKEAYNRQFSRCIKQGVNPEEIPGMFDQTKKKILSTQ
jgi:large subunit ribosomal protein L18